MNIPRMHTHARVPWLQVYSCLGAIVRYGVMITSRLYSMANVEPAINYFIYKDACKTPGTTVATCQSA